MQPTLCSKCKKNVAVVFISRMNEKNEMVNEGLCLQCAAKLGLPQVEDMMKRMGITPEDLENINSEMMQAFGGAEEMSDLPEGGEEDDDEESGKTATFPFLNRLFGNNNQPAPQPQQPADSGQQPTGRKTEKKRKFLDNYCINLSQRAREGKLDAVIGREQEIERVVQILNRRQKNNPCLIGEPGVGKTAIAEGLAQRIVSGDVPFKLRDKEVYLLDLTALVAGTHDVVDLVDDQDHVAGLAYLLDQALHPALELATELRACHQRRQIQQIDLLLPQFERHLALDDPLGQALGDGGLAHTRLADQAGIILLAAVQNLHHALDLLLPANNGIQLALPGTLAQIDAVVIQEFALFLRLAAGPLLSSTAVLGRLLLGRRIAPVAEQPV